MCFNDTLHFIRQQKKSQYSFSLRRGKNVFPEKWWKICNFLKILKFLENTDF